MASVIANAFKRTDSKSTPAPLRPPILTVAQRLEAYRHNMHLADSHLVMCDFKAAKRHYEKANESFLF